MKLKVLIIILFINNYLISQCVITSSQGYSVQVYVNPISVVAPSSCPWGYNYNIELNYTVQYIGTPPPGLYTLQGVLKCGNNSLFFDLPNTSGSGVATTVSNPYNGNSDCSTATVVSLGCQNSNIEISGPGISHSVISCVPSALPISLNYFEVGYYEENSAEIRWETEAELNNDYFIIEKSIDAVNWIENNKIEGAGNSTSPISYRILDEDIDEEIVYYRLKQVDFDGEYSYSDIKALRFKDISDFIIYPNPSTTTIMIKDKNSISNFKIIDMLGKDVTNMSKVLNILENQIEVDISPLNNGSYIIISNNSTKKFNKF